MMAEFETNDTAAYTGEDPEGITLTHETVEDADLYSLATRISNEGSNDSEAKEEECEEREENDEECFTAEDSLDSIRSGESVFKLFTFDSTKSTANVDKCLAFWKKVEEMNLKPVDCSFYKARKQPSDHAGQTVTSATADAAPEKEDFPEETKTQSVISSTSKKESQEQIKRNLENDLQVSWCEALRELQKRKLDRVARVAKPTQCKMCEALSFNLEDDADSVSSHEEIVALNHWRPGKKKGAKPKESKEFAEEGDVFVVESGILEKAAEKGVEEVKQPSAMKIIKPLSQSKIPQKQGKEITKDAKGNISKSELASDSPSKKPATKPPSQSKLRETEKDIANDTEEKELEVHAFSADEIKPEEVQPAMDDTVPDAQTSRSESYLSLMENILSDLLAKMSQDIDARANVKELVNEIIKTAADEIIMKHTAQQATKQPEMPPYSFTGDYPCFCEQPDCMCDIKEQRQASKIKMPEAANKQKRSFAKQSEKVNTSTQCPEEVEEQKKSLQGSYCVICGLSKCICKYIEKCGQSDDVVHTCDMFED